MTGFDHVKDSGERRDFGTGSVRDVRTGKGRYDLLPPVAIKRLAQHFENGAVKYGDKNWELGQPLSGYLDSGLRHGFNLLDLQVDEDHAAAAIWNFIAFLCTAEWIIDGRLPRDLDDIGFCDALEESREDKALPYAGELKVDLNIDTDSFHRSLDGAIERLRDAAQGIPPEWVPKGIYHDPFAYTYDSDAFDDGADEEPGGRPARTWTEDDVVVADMAVPEGIPSEQTTVLSDEGSPDSEGWTVLDRGDAIFAWPPLDDGAPEKSEPLGPEWQEIGHLTEAAFEVATDGLTVDRRPDPWPWIPADKRGPAVMEGEPVEVDQSGSPALDHLFRYVTDLRTKARAAFGLDALQRAAGVAATPPVIGDLKSLTVKPIEVEFPRLPLGSIGLLTGLPVYEVDADDPILHGAAWAIVPQDEAREAVQRSLDRD